LSLSLFGPRTLLRLRLYAWPACDSNVLPSTVCLYGTGGTYGDQGLFLDHGRPRRRSTEMSDQTCTSIVHVGTMPRVRLLENSTRFSSSSLRLLDVKGLRSRSSGILCQQTLPVLATDGCRWASRPCGPCGPCDVCGPYSSSCPRWSTLSPLVSLLTINGRVVVGGSWPVGGHSQRRVASGTRFGSSTFAEAEVTVPSLK
jgi:hypothetical protein